LDEQSVMAMFRRSRKPAPPLHRKQQEIAQQEAQLREKVESLERIVTQSRAPARNKSSARKPDRSAINDVVEKRFHVSIAMEPRSCLTLTKGAGGLVRCARNGGRARSAFSFF
jgi:hypothetical protein